MLPCNLVFFNCGITGEGNDFHAVKKRLRNSVCCIGGTYEQHIGQIIGHIHVMIGERVVLLRVEHLEKRAGGVSAVVFRKLIYFVQHHDRIGHSASFHAFHNSAGHSPDISSAVAADFCFIPDATQADADIFAAKRFSDTLADARFSCAGSAGKEKDRTVLLFV